MVFSHLVGALTMKTLKKIAAFAAAIALVSSIGSGTVLAQFGGAGSVATGGVGGLTAGNEMIEPFGSPGGTIDRAGGMGGTAGVGTTGSSFGSFPATTGVYGGPESAANNSRSFGINMGPDFQNAPGPNFGGNSQFGVRNGSSLNTPLNSLSNGSSMGQSGTARPFGFVPGSTYPHVSSSHSTNIFGQNSTTARLGQHPTRSPAIRPMINGNGYIHPYGSRSSLDDSNRSSAGIGSSSGHYGRPYVGATRTYFPGESGYYQNTALNNRPRK
jgi:hypothetical protein